MSEEDILKNVDGNELRLRPMAACDLTAVAALERKLFSEPWSARLWLEEVNSAVSHALIAEEAGELVAYAGFYLAADEAEITRVAVDPTRQGRGLGKYLLAALLREAALAGARSVYLEVAARNVAARSLYDGFGFKVLGLRKNYYAQDKDDALLMGLQVRE